MAENLYEKFGGTQGIQGIVDSFYQKVLGDPTINHFFANTDMEAQRRHQAAFLSFAFGGTEYTGRRMEDAHRGMDLKPEHFDAVVNHLAVSLREQGAQESDVRTAMSKVETLRNSVLHH